MPFLGFSFLVVPNFIFLFALLSSKDIAFLDRADIKAYIGLPTHRAVYSILLNCLQELVRVGIVTPDSEGGKFEMEDWRTAELFEGMEEESSGGGRLLRIAKECLVCPPPSSELCVVKISTDVNFFMKGMSGRTLRKLPFLAHSYFLQVITQFSSTIASFSVSPHLFLYDNTGSK